MSKSFQVEPTPAGLRQDHPMESGKSSAGAAQLPGVLVVDDESPVLSFLDVALRKHGFAVWSAADGDQALALYDSHRSGIDVVLLDIRMPGRDGPQTLAALQRLNPDILCCFMSGDCGTYSLEALLALGAARVFKKPFSLSEVIAVVSQLVRDAKSVKA